MSADGLAQEFERFRPRLHAIARRILGSPFAADDAVQETWLRLDRAAAGDIDNLGAWLTTVVSRVCIDLIRRESARREEPALDDGAAPDDPPDARAVREEDLALALDVVLDELSPVERLAFVLHDVFGLPFDEIAPIVERTSVNARRLASRARARIRAVDVTRVRRSRRQAVDAFLAAAREGDFGRLLQLLDPDVELRADEAAVALAAGGAQHGAPLLDGRVRGADAVARAFAGRAELAAGADVAQLPAAVYAPDGSVLAAYVVRFAGGRIAGLDVIAEPAALADLLA
ncbi:sigma-70 family RNA polymerase sigma factor [Microbacterium halophytorum]|uniref:sigma-70 family RNA polymerase sigma factor n=1 Tax=Microbacterium halophytorum TaxID=2067568 RepID=UPI000CFC476B|nr:sigma-70 family RNA polymerase sigma factor [Microbacterium halophytorum]